MAKATVNISKVKKLRDAMGLDWKSLKTFRENRKYIVKQYIGKHYSDKGTEEKVPLNLVELFVNTYLTHLAGGVPSASVTTPHSKLKPVATSLKLAIDHLLHEIDFQTTLLHTVSEGLFGIGIVKTGLNHSKTIEFGGYRHDVGQPFADNVQLDDFIFDTTAYTWEKCSYMGDRVKVAISDLEKCELYNKDVVRRIKESQGDSTSQLSGQGLNEEERTSDLGTERSNLSADKEYVQECQIWNIWLPRENLILTIADDDSINEPLHAAEWKGPEYGPYDFLGFNYVPGNTMPLSPVGVLLDLHEATNKIFNKTIAQAKRQKTILGYRDANDAQRIVDSSDGEAVRMEDPKSAHEMTFGGPNQVSVGFAYTLRQYFSALGGNLDVLGGLTSQADTARQEQLLNENASKRVQSMQTEVIRFTKAIIEKLAWYLWYDPLIDIPIIKRVQGTDIEIPTKFSAETIEGDFLDYNINIVPYSLRERTPAQRVQDIMGTINVFAPHMEFMMSQGKQIDYDKLIRILSEYQNLPELMDVFAMNDAPNSMIGEATPKILDKMGGNKTYEHTYRSQAGLQGAEGEGMQNMFNAQANQPGAMMGG